MHWGRSGTAARRTDAVRHIDEAVLVRLAEDLGPEHVAELCRIFLADAREGVEAIRVACTTQDADAAAQSAHRMKSAAGFVGANGVSALCRAVEDLAGQHRFDEVRVCVGRVADELNHASDELAMLIRRLSRRR